MGHPRLVVVGIDGRIQTVTLTRLRAGLGYSRGAELGRFPALAIDPGGERAFVVNEHEPVAIVDLRTLDVRYRETRGLASPARSVAGPARDTGTSNPRRGPDRTAKWLGPRLGDSDAPAGLQILDTRTWRPRTVDRRPTRFEWLGGRLVADARAWDPRARRVRGDGLIIFDRTGQLVYRFRGNASWNSFAGRIFVDDGPSPLLAVLDAHDGHRLGRVPANRLFSVIPGYC